MSMNIFKSSVAFIDSVAFVGLVAVVALFIFLVAAFVWLKRGRERVYEFPLSAPPKRLGAEHAAGVGAVIAFQSHALPPSEQRNKEAEFLSDI